MDAVTITKYTTALVDGPESEVEYDDYQDAVTVAQQRGLQVIARHYVFADSELVEDFTRWHWLLTARHNTTDGDDTGDDAGGRYLPDGPDACFDSAEEAVDNVVERLTRILRELDECEDDTATDPCAPCRAYESVYVAVRALADRQIDLENGSENGYVCAVAVEPAAPVTYRIARIEGGQCDENNHLSDRPAVPHGRSAI